MPDTTQHFSIGELAGDAGISPQTLRHYDRLGLLRPSTRSRARYRRYTLDDRARLELIRTLRELDVDLGTIRKLLHGATNLKAVVELQLATLEHQARLVQRRMSVIRVFLASDDALDTQRLRQLQTLTRLESMEQREFLSTQLERRMAGGGSPGMRRALMDVVRIDLPPTPTREQLDAWLELADMVSAPDFLAQYRGQPSTDDGGKWQHRVFAIFREATQAMQSGMKPDSREALPIVKRWVSALARRNGRRDVRAYAEQMIRQAASTEHRKERRFWQLVAVLRPDVARSPASIASPWLIEGVKAWVAPSLSS